MSDDDTADGLEPRYQMPTYDELPSGSMHCSDAYRYLTEIADCGRKKNKKTEVFHKIAKRHDAVDYYLFSRLFQSERFAHPEISLGVGSATIETAVNRYLNNEGFPAEWIAVELLDEYGTLYDAFVEDTELVAGGDKDNPTFKELYNHLRRLPEMARRPPETSKEVDRVGHITVLLSELAHPSLFLKMLGSGEAMYVYDENITHGAAKTGAHTDAEEMVEERAAMLGDPALAAYDALRDDYTITNRLEPHQPIGEMKAESKYDASNVDELGSEWIAQTKYDGARLFVHHAGDGDYRAYLAGGRDVTAELPELSDIAHRLPDSSFIFDCEATPYDAETGEVLPFQNVLKRIGREGSVGLEEEDVEIQFHFFDMLFWDGNDVRDVRYERRWDVLQDQLHPSMLAQTGTDLEATFKRSLQDDHEGVILKNKHGEYQMDERSHLWQKWKGEPKEVDCRITDVFTGSGRLSGTLGSLGLELDVEEAEPMSVSVGRVGTGFTDGTRDRMYEKHTDESLIGRVVQVSFEELQYSPDEGWALRFPSYDALRPAGETDTVKQVATMLTDNAELYGEWKDSL
jgi:ATP-dependent DNA ligase